MKNSPQTVEEYLENFPLEQQEIGKRIRKLIQEIAPDATESISYGMPAYKLNGPLVYFGLMKQHLGVYATGTSMPEFDAALEKYKRSKGAIQFQYKEEIPYDLIKQIVEFRVKQNFEKD